MATKIFLIRHAETPYNRERKYCGRHNPSLTKEGMYQAKKLSTYFINYKIDIIYSSPLKRTVETAKIIFGDKRKIKFCDELKEIDFGTWEGMTYKKIMKEYSLSYSDWLKDPYNVTMPDGEALASVEKRVLAFLGCLIKHKKNKNIAMVTHFTPIRLVLLSILKENKNDFWKREIGLSSVHVLEYRDSKFIVYSCLKT